MPGSPDRRELRNINEETDSGLSPAPRYSMSDEQLKLFARNHLRDTDRKEYRRMSREGELEDYLQEQADRARTYAEELISRGTFPQQAYHWAVRERLLNVERD